MWSCLIVIDPPGFDTLRGIGEIDELMRVEREIGHQPFQTRILVDAGGSPLGEGQLIAGLLKWRRAILAGDSVGAPRVLVAGPMIQIGSGGPFLPLSSYARLLGLLETDEEVRYVDSLEAAGGPVVETLESFLINNDRPATLVDAYKAAGADHIKLRDMSARMYFAFAAAARSRGMRFGGHADLESALDVSDSGASIIDHPSARTRDDGLVARCFAWNASATVERCRPVAEHFQRNGTWSVPTLAVMALPLNPSKTAQAIQKSLRCTYSDAAIITNCPADSMGVLSLAHRVGLPLMTGTDYDPLRGIGVHRELALFVAEGLTPLEALQAATLNPAKYLRGTDSLGTVAAGKLADLVLLDANPLADITNTTTIRAVVANGRYYDRAALINCWMTFEPRPSRNGRGPAREQRRPASRMAPTRGTKMCAHEGERTQLAC